MKIVLLIGFLMALGSPPAGAQPGAARIEIVEFRVDPTVVEPGQSIEATTIYELRSHEQRPITQTFRLMHDDQQLLGFSATKGEMKEHGRYEVAYKISIPKRARTGQYVLVQLLDAGPGSLATRVVGFAVQTKNGSASRGSGASGKPVASSQASSVPEPMAAPATPRPVLRGVAKLAPIGSPAAAVVREAWTEATVREFVDSDLAGWSLVAPSEEECPQLNRSTVEGDFNRDGSADFAAWVSDSRGIALLAFLSPNRLSTVVRHEKGGWAAPLSVSRKGEQYHDWANGANGTFASDAIVVVYCGKGSTTYVYKAGRFAELVTSD